MFVWMIYPKSSLLKEVSFYYYSAFVAYEEGAPVDLNQEEIAKRNLAEYKSKLIVGWHTDMAVSIYYGHIEIF